MRTLWKYIKPFLNVIYIGLLAKGASALLELLIPYIMSMIIDDIVPTGNVQGIILWTVVMIVCALLAWGTNIFANRNASKVSRDIIEILRNDLFHIVGAVGAFLRVADKIEHTHIAVGTAGGGLLRTGQLAAQTVGGGDQAEVHIFHEKCSFLSCGSRPSFAAGVFCGRSISESIDVTP